MEQKSALYATTPRRRHPTPKYCFRCSRFTSCCLGKDIWQGHHISDWHNGHYFGNLRSQIPSSPYVGVVQESGCLKFPWRIFPADLRQSSIWHACSGKKVYLVKKMAHRLNIADLRPICPRVLSGTVEHSTNTSSWQVRTNKETNLQTDSSQALSLSYSPIDCLREAIAVKEGMQKSTTLARAHPITSSCNTIMLESRRWLGQIWLMRNNSKYFLTFLSCYSNLRDLSIFRYLCAPMSDFRVRVRTWRIPLYTTWNAMPRKQHCLALLVRDNEPFVLFSCCSSHIYSSLTFIPD